MAAFREAGFHDHGVEVRVYQIDGDVRAPDGLADRIEVGCVQLLDRDPFVSDLFLHGFGSGDVEICQNDGFYIQNARDDGRARPALGSATDDGDTLHAQAPLGRALPPGLPPSWGGMLRPPTGHSVYSVKKSKIDAKYRTVQVGVFCFQGSLRHLAVDSCYLPFNPEVAPLQIKVLPFQA